MYIHNRDSVIKGIDEVIAEYRQGRLTEQDIVERFKETIESSRYTELFNQQYIYKQPLGLSDLLASIGSIKAFLLRAEKALLLPELSRLKKLEELIREQELTRVDEIKCDIFAECLAFNLSPSDAIEKVYKEQIVNSYPAIPLQVIEFSLTLIRVNLSRISHSKELEEAFSDLAQLLDDIKESFARLSGSHSF